MRTKTIATTLSVLALLLGAALPAAAGMEGLVLSDGAEYDHFGQAVAVEGAARFGEEAARIVVVGAPDDDDGVKDCGTVRVWLRIAGQSMPWQKLTSPTKAENDHFGWSVGVSGDRIVVGSYAGKVSVFRRDGNNWNHEASLVPAAGSPGAGYGRVVAIDGDLAAVSDENAGVVRVFQRSSGGWSEEAQLSPKSAPGYKLGLGLDIEGDRIIAGSGESAAYVFVREDGAWREEGRLTAADVQSADQFATSVAIAGRYAVVGAPQEEGIAKYSGSIRIYRLDPGTWSLHQKLTASDEKYGSRFGWSVAASGSAILVGAYRDELPTAWYGGAVYEFAPVAGQWKERRKIVTPTAAGGDEFGGAVAVSGTLAVAGARLDNDAGLDSGTAWVFPVDQRVGSPSPVEDGLFGASVSVACDAALVGAPGQRKAYLYRRGGQSWTEVTTFGSGLARFGHAVALDRDGLVIAATDQAFAYWRNGEHWDSGQEIAAARFTTVVSVDVSVDAVAVGGLMRNSSGMGVVVYRRSGGDWIEEQLLTPPAGANLSGFGVAVSLRGDRLAVGSINDAGSGSGRGAVYVYLRSAGSFEIEDELTIPDAADNEHLGVGVSLGEKRLVAGAFGKAAVFEREGHVWKETHRLTPPDGSSEATFGHIVRLSGDTIVVSRFGSPRIARIYTYDGGKWTVHADLETMGTKADLTSLTPLGFCGNTVLVGIDTDSQTLANAGAVYSFHGVGAPIPTLEMTGPKIPEATAGVSFTADFTRTGGLRLPFVWSIDGTCPISGGIDEETGRMDGVYGAAGDYAFTVRVTDGCGADAERSYSVRVNPVPEITSVSLPSGAADRSYLTTLVATGGTGALRFRRSAGDLPAGLSFDPVTGRISGTPNVHGRFPLSFVVEDSLGVESSGAHHTLVVMPVANLIAGKMRSEVALDSGGETMALELVRGTLLTAQVKFPRGSRDAATLRLYGPDGHTVTLGEHLKAKSKSLVLKKLAAPSTGRYLLVLDPAAGFAGDVRLDVKVKAPKKCAESVTVAMGTTETVRFGALPGATAKIVVKAARGSNVLPAIQAVVDEEGRSLLVAEDLRVKGKKATLTIAEPMAGGTIRVILAARDGTAGDMTVKVAVKEPAGYAYSRPDEACVVE